MADNVDPFYVIDDNNNVQKIKLVISGSGVDARAIPYSYVETTGSTSAVLDSLSSSLSSINTKIQSTTSPLYVSGNLGVQFDTGDILRVTSSLENPVYTAVSGSVRVSSSINDPIYVSGNLGVVFDTGDVLNVTSSFQNPVVTAISGTVSLSSSLQNPVYTSVSGTVSISSSLNNPIYTVVSGAIPLSSSLNSPVYTTVSGSIYTISKPSTSASINVYSLTQSILTLCPANINRRSVLIHNSSTEPLFLSLKQDVINAFGGVGDTVPDYWTLVIYENGLYQSDEALSTLAHYGYYTSSVAVVSALVTEVF
jgi:hypothetical protein